MEKEVYSKFNERLFIYRALCDKKLISIETYFELILDEAKESKEKLNEPYLKEEINIE